MLSETDAPATPAAREDEEQADSEKKAPRIWQAWTHEEEDKFFHALRQVGKNFEKITNLVESKNKNQVRHYYYRLIKRMNKLLSSEFTLDAKNSKDVNAAMLAWWSLLGKYKCSSSKLHLKPRRLKAFVAALEQQLLKEKKRVRKKNPKGVATVEEVPATTPAVKGTRKRSCAPKAADARVADKATEPTLTGQLPSPCECGAGSPEAKPEEGEPARPVPAPDVQDMAPPKPLSATTTPAEADNTVIKLKLQLFPIDESTRTRLEQDGHNPHLELTLKGSKSMSSVLQHLTQKWGSSSVATGELRLHPYAAQGQGLSWGANDAGLCAADVYSAVGKPAVFRLRYGWSRADVDVCLPLPSSTGAVDAAPPLEQEEDTPRVQERADVDLQASGCIWLCQKSTDGFGQRLWRDENPKNDTMDWVDSLTVNVDDPSRQFSEPSSSVWGGEETCDAFSFRKVKLKEMTARPQAVVPLLDNSQEAPLFSNSQGPLFGNSNGAPTNSDILYWGDSLGALDGGPALLLNGNSSLGAGISGSLFPDCIDGFPQ